MTPGGELAEIQRAIGRIEGTLGIVGQQCTALFAKFDTVSEEVIEHRGAMKLLAQAHAESLLSQSKMTETLNTEIKPTLEDFRALKNQGRGVILGISIAGGGIGAGIVAVLHKLLIGAGL